MIQDPSLIVSEDVEGAPVRMGETVKIVDTSEDGTFGQVFLGRLGVVVGLVYDDPEGQYPHDPLVRVRVQGVGEDLFFVGELEPRRAPELSGPGEPANPRSRRACHEPPAP